MSDDQIDDLHQFFDSKFAQAEASLKGELASKKDITCLEKRLGKKINDGIKKLSSEMKYGFAGIGDIIEEQINPRLDDHEVRIVKLESAH